jgi:gliding motility-associated-like protein
MAYGNLMLTTSVGEITELAPYAFQYVEGVLKEIPCRYQLQQGVVTFEFPKGYNKRYSLTIDPTIVFATLTGSTPDNWGFSATYDAVGNLYAGGIVSGNQYPTSLGAFEDTFQGGSAGSSMPCDIAISKFNATGTAMLYSTYIGGSADEMPHSLIVDQSNNLVIAGKTLSSNYPTTSNAFSTVHAGQYDIVVTKLNADGTALLGSTFIGGSGNDGVNISAGFFGSHDSLKYNYGDGFRSEVIIDKIGNIYVAASSRSSNFPLTPTAAKSSMGGNQDGVFFKLNSTLSTLIYSTYIGGSNDDACYVLALDTAQTHVYVSGGTKSTDFHLASTGGAYQSTYQGGIADGYICKFLNGANYPLQKVTFIGTNAYDQSYGVQVDLENNVYAMGQTLGAFPVSAGVFSNAGGRQFVIKLDSTLSTALYSTVYGSGASSTPNISPVAFLVDTCQNVYISGWGGTTINGTSTNGLPVTSDAAQSTTDGADFYFIVLSKNALSLLYASFFGSPGKGEHVDGGTSRFDPKGVVYQAICASCGTGSAFPATSGAYATVKGSSNCNLGALKIAFNLGSVDAEAVANPNASGCAPLVVNFTNSSTNATSYFWDFGDNTPTSTTPSPSHTYTVPGNYTAMMVAFNPNACKVRDTVYLQIHVSSDTINADFSYIVLDTCTVPKILLTNSSSTLQGQNLTQSTFEWYIDGVLFFTGVTPPMQNISSGSHSLMMIMRNPAACNNPDTVIKTVDINPAFVEANFVLPPTVCLGDTIYLNGSGTNVTDYTWYVDGVSFSNTAQTTFIANNLGTYTFMLVVTNPNTCNKSDTLQHSITVLPVPVAAFTYSPLIPERNQTIHFINESQNATSYLWQFGDGATSTEINPSHDYRRTGTYNICLTATNSANCPKKICKPISVEIVPLVDVPTGFSPNGDGSNDVLYVRGYSIETMNFKIFNRWGELIFESTDQNKGWDGTYKGVAQPKEVYAYTLSVVFYDGTTAQKQGNVTLLR